MTFGAHLAVARDLVDWNYMHYFGYNEAHNLPHRRLDWTFEWIRCAPLSRDK